MLVAVVTASVATLRALAVVSTATNYTATDSTGSSDSTANRSFTTIAILLVLAAAIKY